MQPLISSLQSLVAVISLSLLDPQRSLETFYETGDVAQLTEAEQDHAPYISKPEALEELHKIFIQAALGLSTLAGPAILAWSIILKTMRDTSMARKEARE